MSDPGSISPRPETGEFPAEFLEATLRLSTDHLPGMGLKSIEDLVAEARETGVDELTLRELVALRKADAPMTLIDLREPPERTSGNKIRGALNIPRGVLEISYPVDALCAARPVGARDLWRHWEFIDAEFVDAVHAAGCRVVAWTVNDATVMERFALLGVDALCTDDVGLARRVVGA